MDPNRRRMTESVLNLTLEIMYLLTGEDYTIVKKTPGTPVAPADQSRGSDGWSRNPSFISDQSALSPSRGENKDRKVLELTNRIIHFLTGEVWQYLMGHKEFVKGVMTENCSTDTPEETNNTATTWEELGPSSTISTPSDHDDCFFAQIKDEPGSRAEEHLTGSNVSTPMDHLQHAAAHIKLETISCDQDQLTYTEIRSSNNHVECSSASIKEEDALSEQGEPAFYEPADNGQVCYSDNLMEAFKVQTIDYNSDGSHPDFDSSLACKEMQMTFEPSMAAVGQIPGSDSGVCMSDASYTTPPQEGHARMKLFVCSKCGKRFSTQLCLFRHERIHAGLGEKGECYIAAGSGIASTDPTGDQYGDKSPVWIGSGQELGTNIRDGSSRGSNYQTDSCDIIDQDSLVLDGAGQKARTRLNHATSETSDLQAECLDTSGHVDLWKLKKTSCVDCGEVFPFKAQRSHLCKSQFSCSECGKWFTSNSHLIVHQRVHTGEKPFGCSVCPKRFATKSTLVIHQRVHTREKPYSCTECRKCFPCNSQLVIHQRTHTGEKPYSCLECGKGFISNSDLLRHRRVHTGERPFKCTECTKCFSQKSHLREHQKTHWR